MSKRVRKSSKPAKPKAYVLLGANEYAKPRAARFATTPIPNCWPRPPTPCTSG